MEQWSSTGGLIQRWMSRKLIPTVASASPLIIARGLVWLAEDLDLLAYHCRADSFFFRRGIVFRDDNDEGVFSFFLFPPNELALSSNAGRFVWLAEDLDLLTCHRGAGSFFSGGALFSGVIVAMGCFLFFIRLTRL